jgi:hypothetical protein
MPLLRANHRGRDSRQRKRIAFACAMSGVTWTTWNRLDASLNSHSLNKSTWYSLTQEVWKTIEAVKADRDTAYTQQLLATNRLSSWPMVHGLIRASLQDSMAVC